MKFQSLNIQILLCEPDLHWGQVWTFMQPVLAAGDTYPIDPDVSKEDAAAYWMAEDKITHVAVNKEGRVVGIYYIRPNQPSLGAHVCNCGYVVDAKARGQGVASFMCKHSQDFARSQGYRAMQYNLVVGTNDVAVALWQKMGFDIIGTLTGAFNHKNLGYVDAYIMYKTLV